MHVAIIDCGAGNLHSVRKAIASQLPEGATLSVVTDAAALSHATHIVLPGVGAFADCMKGFEALPGMRDALETAALHEKKPFLGICVGMQMLFTRGHEHGEHAGLGWFRGEVRLITPSDPTLRIPHMGWNQLHLTTHHSPLTTHINDGDFVYFVHSYAARGCNAAEVLATVDYGGPIVALIGRDNIMGTQFHPEKSQATGLRMIQNFLKR
jgi:glutamine amidotransferase